MCTGDNEDSANSIKKQILKEIGDESADMECNFKMKPEDKKLWVEK